MFEFEIDNIYELYLNRLSLKFISSEGSDFFEFSIKVTDLKRQLVVLWVFRYTVDFR